MKMIVLAFATSLPLLAAALFSSQSRDFYNLKVLTRVGDKTNSVSGSFNNPEAMIDLMTNVVKKIENSKKNDLPIPPKKDNSSLAIDSSVPLQPAQNATQDANSSLIPISDNSNIPGLPFLPGFGQQNGTTSLDQLLKDLNQAIQGTRNSSQPAAQVDPIRDARLGWAIFSLINDARLQVQKPLLAWKEDLAAVCSEKSQQMKVAKSIAPGLKAGIASRLKVEEVQIYELNAKILPSQRTIAEDADAMIKGFQLTGPVRDSLVDEKYTAACAAVSTDIDGSYLEVLLLQEKI